MAELASTLRKCECYNAATWARRVTGDHRFGDRHCLGAWGGSQKSSVEGGKGFRVEDGMSSTKCNPRQILKYMILLVEVQW
jgi:hypothetical protein